MKSVNEIVRGIGVLAAAIVIGGFLYFRPPLTDHVVESSSRVAQSESSSGNQSEESGSNKEPSSNQIASGQSSQNSSTEVSQSSTQDNPQTLRGLDVSHYQGSINWSKVDSNDIDFAYLKASEGINYKDPRFAENVENLKTVDMP